MIITQAVISSTLTGGIIVRLHKSQVLFFESFELIPAYLIQRDNGISMLNEKPKELREGEFLYQLKGEL